MNLKVLWKLKLYEHLIPGISIGSLSMMRCVLGKWIIKIWIPCQAHLNLVLKCVSYHIVAFQNGIPQSHYRSRESYCAISKISIRFFSWGHSIHTYFSDFLLYLYYTIITRLVSWPCFLNWFLLTVHYCSIMQSYRHFIYKSIPIWVRGVRATWHTTSKKNEILN